MISDKWQNNSDENLNVNTCPTPITYQGNIVRYTDLLNVIEAER